jgi:transposase InsO family protein
MKSRWGYRTLCDIIRRDRVVNHKKVHRIYKLEQLQVRRRRRRKRTVAAQRVPMALPDRVNQRWSMDFTRDTLANGRAFRTLNIVDDYTPECPAIEVDHSLPGMRVVRVLDHLAETRGLPRPSLSTTALNSRAVSWIAGRTDVTCDCISSILVNLCRTPSSRASTESSGTSASTSTGS